jgi:peptidoglycan/xylan/chitin deacetylase (PgdA/CDA1 family)
MIIRTDLNMDELLALIERVNTQTERIAALEAAGDALVASGEEMAAHAWALRPTPRVSELERLGGFQMARDAWRALVAPREEGPDTHAQGQVQCANCTHIWRAVWPLVASALECPRCNYMTPVEGQE